MSSDIKMSSDKEKPSCNPHISRKEFLAKVVQKAAIAGTIVAAPAIADAFLAPPAFAQASTNVCCSIESVTDCSQDTDFCNDTGCLASTECL